MDEGLAKQQHLRYMLSKIDALRKELEAPAADRRSMCDPKIVELSARLDLMINDYYRTLSSRLNAATESS